MSSPTMPVLLPTGWVTMTADEIVMDDSTCTWEEKYDWWQTQCGNQFEFISGSPSQNEFRFCPYCGKLIQEITED